MTKAIALPGILKVTGPSLLITLVSLTLLNSSLPEKHPEVYTGIIIDLCLLSPILVLLLSRYYKLSSALMIPFLLVGIIACRFLVPSGHLGIVNVLSNTVLPILELGILSFTGYKVLRFIRNKSRKDFSSEDLRSEILESFRQLGLPEKVAGFLFTELWILYSVFFMWRPVKSKAKTFTMYRESAQIPLCIALLAVLGIETVVLHKLLVSNFETLAWILTILSIYSAFYFLAHIKTLMLRPTQITGEAVWLKNGVLGEIKVNFSDLKKVECTTSIPANLMEQTRGLGLNNPPETFNVLLYFSNPQKVILPHGAPKSCMLLAVYIDHPGEFQKVIHQRLESAKKTLV